MCSTSRFQVLRASGTDACLYTGLSTQKVLYVLAHGGRYAIGNIYCQVPRALHGEAESRKPFHVPLSIEINVTEKGKKKQAGPWGCHMTAR